MPFRISLETEKIVAMLRKEPKTPVTGLIVVKFIDRVSRITLRHFKIKIPQNEIKALSAGKSRLDRLLK
jgi:hypothetical protein